MARDPPRGREDRSEGAEARAERRTRSLEEPLDVRVMSRDPYPVLEVRNPIHRTRYLVLLPEFPSGSVQLCTCTDFARRGLGTCKHLEAGFRWLSSHPDAQPPAGPRPRERANDTWREIDRRLQASGPVEGRRAKDLASAGDPLFE